MLALSAAAELAWWTAGLATLSFLLAALEHGWTKLSRTRLAETGAGPADRTRLAELLAEGDRVEDGLIVLRVLAQVALVMVLVVWFQEVFADAADPGALPVVLAGTTAFLWITLFCRVLPAEMSADLLTGLVRRTLPVCVAVARVLGPPIELFRRLARTVTGHTVEAEAAMYASEILSTLEEGEREGHLAEDQADMIERVLELRDTEVRHLMTPRTDMEVLDISATVAEARDEVGRSGRSRYPLVEGNVDKVAGILHVKDLLGQADDTPLSALAREPSYVPDTKFGTDLLTDFRNSKAHLAIVLDEYGGTAGLVTIEDVLEEIVGEIDDEFDDDEELEDVQIVDESHVIAPGSMHVDDLNEKLSIHLPESDDWSTLGGFIFHSLGRLPKVGEELRHENLLLRIDVVEDRRISKVAIEIEQAAA